MLSQNLLGAANTETTGLIEKYQYEGQGKLLRSRRRWRIMDSRWSWSWTSAFVVVVVVLVLGVLVSGIRFRDGTTADIGISSKGTGIHISTLHPQFLPSVGKKHHSSPPNRLVIIGDVHGMKDQLSLLLRKIEFNSRADHLILTGDIIDKGPDSKGVVDLVMGLGEKASCVMGNHEFKAIRQQRDWLLAMGDRRIRWLESCPHILRVGRLGAMGEVVVVHAGLEPGRKLERQRPRDVMNMRVIDKHGTPDSRKEGVDWFERWNEHQMTLKENKRMTVVYGHNSGLGLQDHAYTKGLDTGCVNGGKLTALVIEGGQTRHTTRYVQVECPNAR